MAGKPTYEELEQRVKELEKEAAQGEGGEAAEYKRIWRVFSQSPIPTLVLSKKGEIVEYNAAMAQVTGYAHEEVPDITAWMPKVYPNEEYRNKVIEISRRSRLREIDVMRDVFVITTKSGQERHIQFSVHDILDDGRQTDFQVVQGEDITARKQAEQSLRASEARWRSLVENAPDIIFTVDREGKILFINYPPAGLSTEDALGIDATDYVAPDYRDTVRKSIQRVFKTGNPDSFEIAARGPHDTTSWYSTRLGPIKHDGEIEAVLLITRDITDRKRAEDRLRKREAELEVKTAGLEELNTALKVLLKKRDEDRAELEEKVLSNVKELVEPFLVRLKDSVLDARQSALVGILESNLKDIVSPFLRQLSSKYMGLTPTEVRVARLVRDGRPTKEIAQLLGTSKTTINFHRRSLREKLGIKNKKVNLSAHLSTFPQ